MLDRTGLKVGEIDVFEVNEAFAAQALAVVRELDLPADRTNPNGSGISLGHPALGVREHHDRIPRQNLNSHEPPSGLPSRLYVPQRS